MAPTRGNSQTVLVDEFDFRGDTSAIEMSYEVPELDVTNLASAAMEYIAGLRTGRLTQRGYFMGVLADGTEYELRARFGTTTSTVAYLPDRTAGNPAYVFPGAALVGMPIKADVAGLITLDGEWVSASGNGRRGKLVCYQTTISATGTGAYIDTGSVGSAGGFAYLFVHSINGSASGTSTNSVITLESATTSGGTYATEATFTFSATGAFAATMSGTVNRYERLNTTSMGGATTIVVSAVTVVTNVTM